MALFKHKPDFELDPFTDLIFNALLIFTFLFLMALLLLNPPAKSGIIDPKAEFLVTVSWPDNDPNDIDVWAAGPAGAQVWFMRPQDGLLHLDRDDRGAKNNSVIVNGREITSPIRQEIVTLRGLVPGEYVVNAHYYESKDKLPVDVSVAVVKVNPQAEIVYTGTQQIPAKGDERTLVRFSIDESGTVIDLNTRPLTIVQRSGL